VPASRCCWCTGSGTTGSVSSDSPAASPLRHRPGTRDHILPPRQAEQARRQFPAARIVTLPGCGHVPMNDDPDLVAQVILAATTPR
jgi:pimeloyl-ACP methyl ester carboxylesterase